MKHETKFAQWIRFGGTSEFLVLLRTQLEIENKFEVVPQRLLETILDKGLAAAVAQINQSLPDNSSVNISSVDLSDIKSEFADAVALRIGQIGLPLNADDAVINAAIRRYTALISARLQQEGLGASQYVWRSSDDAVVRATHQQYDDQQFSWENPPEDGNPGAAYGCRCTAEPVLDSVTIPEYGVCDIVNSEMLLEVFPDAQLDRLSELAKEIDLQIVTGSLDTPERRAHFFGQVAIEAGSEADVEENLNYRASALETIFSYFRRNPEEAELFGRTSEHVADQEAIANRAYANRNGNGDVESGDGWLYRGRGLKQLTGRSNYRDFTRWHNQIFTERVNFEDDPDLLLLPKYAVRSALYFWVENGLHLVADEGVSEVVTDQITAVINLHTESYLERWQQVDRLYQNDVFADVCNFSTARPRFEDQ
jgi:predicted chitinase